MVLARPGAVLAASPAMSALCLRRALPLLGSRHRHLLPARSQERERRDHPRGTPCKLSWDAKLRVSHAMHLFLSATWCLGKNVCIAGPQDQACAWWRLEADLGKASLLQSRGAAGRKLLIASELCSIGSKAGLGPGLPPRPQSLISIY